MAQVGEKRPAPVEDDTESDTETTPKRLAGPCPGNTALADKAAADEQKIIAEVTGCGIEGMVTAVEVTQAKAEAEKNAAKAEAEKKAKDLKDLIMSPNNINILGCAITTVMETPRKAIITNFTRLLAEDMSKKDFKTLVDNFQLEALFPVDPSKTRGLTTDQKLALLTHNEAIDDLKIFVKQIGKNFNTLDVFEKLQIKVFAKKIQTEKLKELKELKQVPMGVK
jgi:hypothetical protein